MEITMHPTCHALYGDITLQEYADRVVPSIRFKDEVHIDVKKTFLVIEKLLVHSYYEYEFFDVAYAKALQTFEMALKLRYEELEKRKWNSKKALIYLIKYFRIGRLFEINDRRYSDHVRQTRNYLSHPERYNLAGIVGRHWIDTTVDLINDVYEDPELRRQRLCKRAVAARMLHRLIIGGAIFEGPGFRLPLYGAEILFVNNKTDPAIYTFAIFPVFSDPDNDEQGPFIVNVPETFVNWSTDRIKVLPGTNFQFDVHNKINSIEQATLAEWVSNRVTDAFIAKQGFNSFRINECFCGLRRSFHFQPIAISNDEKEKER
jgi:hypothetical protein